MAYGELKNENYVVIPAWATKPPYNLKNNELIIYSIIYGFSQINNQCFCGSISYLQLWTNSSRQGVINNLNSLIKKGLITKEECKPTNKYYVTDLTDMVYGPTGEDLSQIEEDYVNYSIPVEKEQKTEERSPVEQKLELYKTVEEIVTYLNKTCKTCFKSTTQVTRNLIRRRLSEGFSVEDFKSVIDIKYKMWGEKPHPFGNGQMSNDFLRPTTLFGDGFESYLNEARQAKHKRSVTTNSKSESTKIDEVRSNKVF